MPNTSRGGGISRKITSSEDRNRLKEIAQELEVPEGMGVILRTAGASRTKLEVKRDFEYLMRIWEQVRDLTLKSTAPKLVYEEGSLVKRSIRDLYSKDIDEIVTAGEEGYNEAKEFMRMLMPSHAKNVKLYRDSQPIFTRYGCESQLDAMFSPTVQLKSGGYIVINQAEALVAIDVNSGRATREHNIEDTAVKTNSEAAEEIARQLRLRDLAGLIVIDFIDMDDHRNNRTVERRVKEALKHDRARIQVGRISHFGLLEMSRQRIRSSVLESSTEKCPICGGSGHVRSVGSVTLALLRAIEETLLKGATHNLVVRTRPEVALYVLNQKRGHLRALEERFRINVTINADETVVGAQAFTVERGEQVHSVEAARELAAQHSESLPPLVDEADAQVSDEHGEDVAVAEPGEGDEAQADDAQADQAERGAEGERDSHRRRRRRRGGRGRSRGGEHRDQPAPAEFAGEAPQPSGEQEPAADDADAAEEGQPSEQFAQTGQNGGERGPDDGRRRRRRGRRGGRRHRRGNGEGEHPQHHGNGGSGFQPREDAQPHYGEPAEQFRPEPQSEETPPRAESPAPAPEPVAAAAAEAEAPRRRSTVREPVSWTPSAPSSHAAAPSPAPAPEPAASSTAADDGPPKRGWWARRLMGDK
jgi:ribonuclease E